MISIKEKYALFMQDCMNNRDPSHRFDEGGLAIRVYPKHKRVLSMLPMNTGFPLTDGNNLPKTVYSQDIDLYLILARVAEELLEENQIDSQWVYLTAFTWIYPGFSLHKEDAGLWSVFWQGTPVKANLLLPNAKLLVQNAKRYVEGWTYHPSSKKIIHDPSGVWMIVQSGYPYYTLCRYILENPTFSP